MAREREPIRGPLGIWPYPILNPILELIERLRERRLARLRRFPASSPSSGLRTTVKNVEQIQWVDYKGRKRTLVIEREVKET